MSGHGPQWFPACYSDTGFDVLARDWGADLFRIAMYVDEGGYNNDPTGWRTKVDTYIDQISKKGMYVLLDWHMLAKGNPNDNLEPAKAFFEYMSQKHGSRTNIIYEIANEPNGNQVTWAEIKKYADVIIPIIRKNDPDAPIVVGTPGWSSLAVSGGGKLQDILDNRIVDDNTLYTFHFYSVSHQDTYYNSVVKAIDAGLPLFVTEFGTQDYSGSTDASLPTFGKNDFVYAQKYLDLFAKYKISWANWNYADGDKLGEVLAKGGCKANNFNNNLKDAGTWIKDKIQNPPDDF
jgi:endoglucanase